MKTDEIKKLAVKIVVFIILVCVIILYIFLEKNAPDSLVINEVAFSHGNNIE